MEGIGARKIMAMSLMVMMMAALLAARVHAVDDLDAAIHPSDIDGEHRTLPCIRICFKKCLFEIFPPRALTCFGLCMSKCKIGPSEAVFKCTSDCANSMVKSYNPIDADKVESFIDSCYESCKHK